MNVTGAFPTGRCLRRRCLFAACVVLVATALLVSASGASQPAPVVLTARGIGPVRLGIPKGRTVAALTALFGRQTGAGINTACGSRYTEAVWVDLAVEFRDGTFTGYRYVRGGYPLTTVGSPRRVATPTARPRLRTIRGITLGSRLGALHVDYPTLRSIGVAEWIAPNGIIFIAKSPSAGAVAEIKRGTCGGF